MQLLWDWFAAPLQYDFMVTAVLVSAFVGVVCAVLSCFITLKGWSLMGDAVSHAVLPGVVLSYVVGLPFAVGAFVAGLASVTLIGYIKSRTRVKEDTVIGVVFTGFFALGLVLITKVTSEVHLQHILFGHLLGITTSELIQTVALGAVTLVVAGFILRRDLLLFCFDPQHARSIGINTTFLYYTLLTLLALTVVSALQAVGVILVIAMLITPGAIAYLLTDRFDRMMLYAAAASVLACVSGTYLSYHLDASTGGCIVVMLALLFGAAMALAPKHGLFARRRAALRDRASRTPAPIAPAVAAEGASD